MTHFSSLSLPQELLNNLPTLGYETMTPIQEQSLPIMLKGEDVIAQAKTGSGKTAAFGLSLLNRLNVKNFSVQALVLCPTRELAEQVSQTLRSLSRLLPNVKILNLSGGAPLKPQLDSLRHGAHVIVGTPGRVQKHLDQESLSLSALQTVVLDEADRMLDMGFIDAIKEIMMSCPKQKQTLFFSATYPDEIKKLCNQFMKNPKKVVIDSVHIHNEIEQLFYEVNTKENKYPLLKSLLLHHKPDSTLIFCNTKQQTSELSSQLLQDGFSAIALNGDMEQSERDLVVIRFVNQSCSIMVATDVAARGLDIRELPAVINYELAFEKDVHTHRIGRTGRAGHKGLALSLTTPSDAKRLIAIEENLKHSVSWGNKDDLKTNNERPASPEMVTLCLSAGKKDKIRPGDILGALTKDAGLSSDMIGKINIGPMYSYVAIHKSQSEKAFKHFQMGKLKGRRANVKKIC